MVIVLQISTSFDSSLDLLSSYTVSKQILYQKCGQWNLSFSYAFSETTLLLLKTHAVLNTAIFKDNIC